MNFHTLGNLLSSEIYKFAIVGVGGVCIVLGLSAVFTSIFAIFYMVSVLMALEISLIPAFIAHDRWTFSHVNKISKPIERFVKYNLVSLIGFGVNEFVLVLLTEQIKLHYIISEVFAITIAFLFNYIFNKRISWKQ